MDYIRCGRGNHASAWDWLGRGEFQFGSVQGDDDYGERSIDVRARMNQKRLLVLVSW